MKRKFSYSLGVNPVAVKPLRFDMELKKSDAFQFVMQLIAEKKFAKAVKYLDALRANESVAKEEIEWLLGRVYLSQSKYNQATKHLNKALEINENYFNAWASLGELHCMVKEPKLAIDFMLKAHKIRPNDADVLRVIAECCVEGTELEAATVYYLESIKRNSARNWVSWHGLSNTYHAQGKIKHAIMAAERYLTDLQEIEKTVNRFGAEAHGSYLFILMAHYLDYKKLMAAFKQWADVYASDEDIDYPLMRPLENRKLRIGYVGSDFFAHAATKIYEPLFRLADKEKFEIYAYSSGAIMDHITEELRPYFDRYLNVVDYSDDQLFDRIRSDEVDILVDLNGHTNHNRLMVFTRKAAPVQITGVGFVSALNIPQFDFFLTDKHITDASRENVTADAPLFVPSVMHWKPDPGFEVDLPEVPPYEKNGFITFGCGNNLYKMNDQVIGVWASIMKEVRNSRIIIKCKQMECNYTQRILLDKFKGFGIDEDRIQLIGTTGFREHIWMMGMVDICLDPFPYQGGITTCESLYMGCPVVTLNEGTRTSVSIVKNVGAQAGYVAEDVREYREKAIKLAKEIKEGKWSSRSELREIFLSSIVCDSESYCRSVENAYTEIARLFDLAMKEL